MPHFETFTKRLVPLSRDPLVTIQRRGTISLNKSAHVTLGETDAVELLYDRDACVLGLRPCAATVEHSYPLRRTSRKSTGPFVISAMAFTRFYGIDISVSRRWIGHLDEGVLCVELNSDCEVVTGNRSRDYVPES